MLSEAKQGFFCKLFAKEAVFTGGFQLIPWNKTSWFQSRRWDSNQAEEEGRQRDANHSPHKEGKSTKGIEEHSKCNRMCNVSALQEPVEGLLLQVHHIVWSSTLPTNIVTIKKVPPKKDIQVLQKSKFSQYTKSRITRAHEAHHKNKFH